ncbi:MAG: methyltransferase [Rhizobiales bacterium]|nr:methyltransferase [Hyphomicrobiales bacterium]
MIDCPAPDMLFGGLLRLSQPPKGHRAGTDGVLLAAATPADAVRIADFGASSGLVGLRAAQINPQARVTLFEQDAEIAALARANIATNDLDGRVEVAQRDILEPGTLTTWREAFDCVLSNPPFHEAGRTRMPTAKSAAYVMKPQGGGSGLQVWLRRATSVLAPKGRLVLIHRADEIGAVLEALKGRFGGIRLIFVHPRQDEPAIRVLAGATKASRAPLSILPPLVLHESDGCFTPFAEGLNRGKANLPLFE